MAGRTTIKPYKLKPTGETLSRDDLATWRQILLGHIRQNPKWLQFLPTSSVNPKWTCSDEDETNGLVEMNEPVGTAAPTINQTKTDVLRADFADFLTCVATYAPAGFNDTIQRESTSFNWVIDLIKSTYGLDTKGENFLGIDDLKFDFDGGFTYQQAYMQVKDFVCAGLLKSGSMFESKKVSANETLSPTTKNFITREWLAKIDRRLPKHVKDTRGHLFTEERPSLACNQKILADQIPTMLAELDSKPESLAQGNVNIGYVPVPRGGMNRGRFNQGFNQSRGGFRGRPQLLLPRAQTRQPNSGTGCFRCLEATPKRYDAAKTHLVKDCPWPANNQHRRNPPNFRVVLFPEHQAMQQPQMATVSMGHDEYYGQDAEYYHDDPQYYGQYFQQQQLGQQEATIEELQNL